MHGKTVKLLCAMVLGVTAVIGCVATPAMASGGITIVIGNWHCDQGGSINSAQGLGDFKKSVHHMR